MDGEQHSRKLIAKKQGESLENFQCSYTDIVPLEELIPHERNRNFHPPEQIDRMAKIIAYQGQRHPIVVSTLSGSIVAGHGRVMALKKLGWKEAAVCYQDFDDEEQEYLFLQSDNAIASWAELDLSGINMDLGELGPFDIELLGLKDFTIEPLDRALDEDTKKIQDDMNKKYELEIKFPNEMEMMDIHDDLLARGYLVRIKE